MCFFNDAIFAVPVVGGDGDDGGGAVETADWRSAGERKFIGLVVYGRWTIFSRV